MPRAPEVLALATLAGVSIGGPAGAASYRVVYSFGGVHKDAGWPIASLIEADGQLYGTASQFGAHRHGEVFAIDPTTGVYSVVYSFTGSKDGGLPSGSLLKVGDLLYGTARAGGANEGGTVFSIKRRTYAHTTLYSFKGGSDGSLPLAALMNVGGILYGTTAGGGGGKCTEQYYGCGTVFSLNRQTRTETVVHSLTGARRNGAYPIASLLNVDGTLYGTTNYGGTGHCKVDTQPPGCGTVFAVNPTTGKETVVHSMTGAHGDGAFPVGGLLNVGGTLYGTTFSGGTAAYGTVFALVPATGAYTIVYAFKGGSDGSGPLASLIKVGGKLYGTTSGESGSGCNGACGTVFELDPATGKETVVHAFGSGKDGEVPESALLNVGGTLYGTTIIGGTANWGTVFAITL